MNHYRIFVLIAAFVVQVLTLHDVADAAPPNDTCSTATTIMSDLYFPPLLDTTTANASTSEPQEDCEAGNIGVSNTVWYKFTPSSDGTATINTSGSNYDTVLSVFTSCSSSANDIACDDDSGPGTTSQIAVVSMNSGTTYRIKVSDYNTAPGGGLLDFNFVFIGQPDLEASIGANSEPWEWGQTVTADLTIENTGSGVAGQSVAVLVMSANSTIDVNDYAIHTYVVPALGSDQQYFLNNWQWTLPSSPPSGFPANGTVYFGLIADRWEEVSESDEDNNTDNDPVTMSTPPPPQPSITSTSPEPVPGCNCNQTLTIYGSNFVSGCTVTLYDITYGDGPYFKPTTFINSGQITISANFTDTTATWTAQVVNPSGASSNVFQFHVVASAPTPTITSTSPEPVPGCNCNQTLTIYGSNFVSGCTVTLYDITYGDGPYFKPTTFINSGQITISANFTDTTATWTAQVVNPSGASSNVFQFHVVASAPAPTITSTSPEPVPGCNCNQTLTIYGSNFVPGCTVTLWDITYGDGPYIKPTTFINSGQITISANFTNNTATWTAQVATPGGSSSNVFQFHVIATVSTPSITSTSPEPVPGCNCNQTLTIYGSNFVSGAYVTLYDITYGDGPYVKPTTFINSEQITISANFTANTATWAAQVFNPDGGFSNVFQFHVEGASCLPLGVEAGEPQIVDGFDYPFSPPDGLPMCSGSPSCGGATGQCSNMWGLAQEFSECNTNYTTGLCTCPMNGLPGKLHLGEDWNFGFGPDDLNKPIYAVASGEVVYAQDYVPGTLDSFEGVIIILHTGTNLQVPGGPSVSQVESMYAHLDATTINNWVRVGDTVTRGQQIGRIGQTPVGSDGPHLHFEIRTTLNMGVGPGYAPTLSTVGWTDPSDFIDANRPGSLTSFGGTVTNASTGTPVVNATVTWASTFSTQTQAPNGAFSFTNVPCQCDYLVISAPGYNTATLYHCPQCNNNSPPQNVECPPASSCPPGGIAGDKALFDIGDTVEVFGTGGVGLKAWSNTCTGEYCVKPDGSTGVIMQVHQCCGGYIRWRIQWDDDGSIRWSAEGDPNTGEFWLQKISACVGDIVPSSGNGIVNVDDLLAVINAWGPCGGCAADIAPVGGNGVVNVDDLLAVINAWGACP